MNQTFDAIAQLAELNHRVANSFQMVSGLIGREAGRVDEPAASILRKAEAQLHAFALLNRALRHGDTPDPRPCAGAYLDEVCAHLEGACLRPFGIALETVLDRPLPVNVSLCQTLGLIATELVLNAAKHAFVGRDDGAVGVFLKRADEPAVVVLGVMDNGCGMVALDTASCGQGLAFVHRLAASVAGDCQVASGSGGTRFVVSAPLR